MEHIEELIEQIKKAKKICVFTGAGISCPSGIPDFRSADGLYNSGECKGYSPEEIISHGFFFSHTELFYDFYKSKMIYTAAKPNIGHLLFAQLEKMGKEISVVTQNIDGLHTAAGNSKVYELHGSVHRNYCLSCGAFYDAQYICDAAGAPRCKKCGGTVKPDVVLYGEGLDDKTVRGAVEAIAKADLLIIIGTSLAVYPAASFIGYFRGDCLALINKSETPVDRKANIVIYGDIKDVGEKISLVLNNNQK